ncbi:Emopamil-binding protein [Xylariaceae sp. FL0804]|nr:Emopamil-binding protein [Xylariaceae sp. FL0804]
MDSSKAPSSSSLPPDLFDQTTLVSLASTVTMLGAAYYASLRALGGGGDGVSGRTRALFVWHAFDALIHLCLEAGFLYHCFFSWVPLDGVADPLALMPTAHHFLGHTDRAYGPQAGGDGFIAQLWMVYARADRRWGGADLSVISLELLTVFIAGPLACLVCYLLARRDARVNAVMIVLATMELYGGFITFCPEWLVLNYNLDTSNWMYLWLYLVFFNGLWVALPLYAIWAAFWDIDDAFAAKAFAAKVRSAAARKGQ